MQYRISTLVALFSATTALAYLDCGGGRAPPKTTVPGCPGYVDPATVVPTSTALTAESYATESYHYVYTTTTASRSLVTDQPETEVDSNQDYTVYEDPDAEPGCNCRGYLCQYATPGCVNLDASSTITANSGWETQSFDPESYYSYIRTASSAGGELSMDGVRIELATAIPSSSSYGSSSKIKTQKTSSTVTASATGSATETAAITLATSTISASSSQVASNSSSSSSSSNATASTTAPIVANTNSASTFSGMASMVALLVSGAAAIVML